MKELLTDNFQHMVDECTIRHRSILDILAKCHEAGARVNRAVAKATTSCGCISVNAQKPAIPEDISLQQLPEYMSHHIEGKLCDECRETIESEIGMHFFYLASLCNAFDMNLHKILQKEQKKMDTLGVYRLS